MTSGLLSMYKLNLLLDLQCFSYGAKLEDQIITDRHPNPLFSVCIISQNAERKIMQTNCVRKTGAALLKLKHAAYNAAC